MYSGSDSDDENGEIVPQAMRDIAKNVSLDLLPDKSKRIYTAAYNAFKKWRKENGSNSYCEDVLLAYFAHLSTLYSPPSLWLTFSMLKSTFKAFNNIDISTYLKLISFLKKMSVGYRSNKSLIFTSDQISRFFKEAPNDFYLCEKVIVIFGIYGALRREEFTNILTSDVKKLDKEEVLLVNITKIKNYVPRSFTITDTNNCTRERFTTNTTSVKEYPIGNMKSSCNQNTVNTPQVKEYLYTVNYYPNIGLYAQDLFKSSQPNFIFQNCNIIIKTDNNKGITGAIVEDKATQTDN